MSEKSLSEKRVEMKWGQFMYSETRVREAVKRANEKLKDKQDVTFVKAGDLPEDFEVASMKDVMRGYEAIDEIWKEEFGDKLT